MTSKASLDDEQRRASRKEFAAFVKSAREASGRSRNDVGAHLKVSNQVVANWETGRSVPDHQVAQDLERLLAPHAPGLAKLAGKARHPRAPVPPSRPSPSAPSRPRRLAELAGALVVGAVLSCALTLAVASSADDGAQSPARAAPPTAIGSADSEPVLLEDWVKTRHAEPGKPITDYDAHDYLYNVNAGVMRQDIQGLLPAIDRALAELSAGSATRTMTARRLRSLIPVAEKTYKFYTDFPYFWLAAHRREAHERIVGHLANLVEGLRQSGDNARRNRDEKLDAFDLLREIVDRLHAAIEDLDLHGPGGENGYLMIKCRGDLDLTVGARLNGTRFNPHYNRDRARRRCPKRP